jgi:hypothetical protein
MWFVLGALIGALGGCLVCIRYLRREIAADIGPRLRRIQLQLDNLETALNLTMVTRYADMAGNLSQRPSVLPGPMVPPHPRSPDSSFGM